MTPEQLHLLVADLYREIAPKLPAKSWHCREVACLALAADRATGGHGHLAAGTMRLESGDVTQHACFITDSGQVIHGFNGEVQLAERASLGLTLGMVP